MADWYRHDIPAWMDGTEGLSANAYRAYHVIVQLIYLHEGPVTLNERGLAGRCNQHIISFRSALNELITSGKLTLTEGKLDNNRAESELNHIQTNRNNAAKGGSSPRKSRINKASVEASLQASSSPRREKSRGEESREDITRASRGKTDLPRDWMPSEDLVASLVAEGVQRTKIHNELPRFRDYWIGHGKRMADWDATFRNWMRRSGTNGHGTGPPSAAKSSPFVQAAREIYQEQQENAGTTPSLLTHRRN